MMAAERERAQQHDGICVHHAEPAEHTKSAEGFVASAKPREHHACRSRIVDTKKVTGLKKIKIK